jgi:hypothetical protein
MGFTVLQLEEVAVAPRPVPAFDTTEGGGVQRVTLALALALT